MAPSPSDRIELARPDLPSQVGLQSRVGTSCPAAQPVVVELDDRRNRLQHGPYGSVNPLDMTKMAGVLDDHRVDG
jgi:hypothetical protein